MITIECPKCETFFTPRRANMKYCSATCAKNATRANRFFENRNRNERHYDRAAALLEAIRSLHSSEHPEFVAELLLTAMQGDGGLKNILTDPKLLLAQSSTQNIAQRVNALCREGAGRTVIQILQSGDLSAITRIETMIWHPDRCPRARPEGWDYRLLLPAHLGGGRAQSSSAYIIRPEEKLTEGTTKKTGRMPLHHELRSAPTEKVEEDGMTILQSLAA